MNYYKEYSDVDFSNLRPWEKQVIEVLKDAVVACGDIYSLQKNADCFGGNFYPCDVSKEQLEVFGKENPEIFSPYTIVELDETGKPVPIKYSVKFKNEISRIVHSLEKAASIYEQYGFSLYSIYLNQLSKDLMNDDYEASEKIWLKLDWKVNVDIKLGPIETYQDKLFGVKRAFQANLRIKNDVDAKNIGEYIDVAHALADVSSGSLKSRTPESKTIIVRVDKIVAVSGWHADLIPRTSNYPADISQIRHGSKILIYTNNIELKQKVILKIITDLFKLTNADLLGDYDLAAIRTCTLHEICETVSKQEHPEDYGKFGDIGDAFTELNADMAAIKLASHQVLKGVFSAEDYKFYIIEFLASALRGWIYGKSISNGVRTFSDSYKLVLNLLIENNAMKITEDEKIEIDLPAVYTHVDILNKNLHTYLITRDKKSIDGLYSKYSSDTNLEKLSKKLSKIVFGEA